MPRRGENIYKRRDGRWEGRYIESHSADGKAKYHSVYGHTYREVKTKLQNHTSHRKLSGAELTVCDWISEYIVSQKDKLKISTYKVYERYFNNHIQPFFKNIKLRLLDTNILQAFINSQRNLSPSTIKGIFSLVRESLKTANRAGYIDAVWLNVDIPKDKRPSVSVFGISEQRMIEAALDLDENPNELGVLICLYTGLRIGELCGLRWEDVNFNSGTIAVNRTVQRMSIDGKSCLIELPPKSESSQRKIPVPGFLLDILKCRCAASESRYVLSINSHVMDPRTYQNQYRRVLERAGVEYANFHSLRHTFSVRALESGFDIKTLSEILGHADASVTLKKYAHSLDEHKRASMERLSALRMNG
ncbi:MAG: tyrosine-type recombinase/integrase [Candidatus Ornithomonoglobus sp.]